MKSKEPDKIENIINSLKKLGFHDDQIHTSLGDNEPIFILQKLISKSYIYVSVCKHKQYNCINFEPLIGLFIDINNIKHDNIIKETKRVLSVYKKISNIESLIKKNFKKHIT